MKSIPGFILSLISAGLYAYVLITIFMRGPLQFISESLVGAFVGVLLSIVLLPIIIILFIMGIVACVLTIVGSALTGASKTKAGGVLVIVGAAIGILFAWTMYMIPLFVGIAGGIVTLVQGRK
jgi:hypothetical protein